MGNSHLFYSILTFVLFDNVAYIPHFFISAGIRTLQCHFNQSSIDLSIIKLFVKWLFDVFVSFSGLCEIDIFFYGSLHGEQFLLLQAAFGVFFCSIVLFQVHALEGLAQSGSF